MTPEPTEFGSLPVACHEANAKRLRTQARTRIIVKMIAACARYAVAPFAFGRRMCSSSRGNISTKLHGR